MLKKLNSPAEKEFIPVKTAAMVLRLFAAGFMFYGHGLGKLMMVAYGNFQFGDPIGLGPVVSLILAAFAEGICSFLIFIGFWTRLSSLILVINMSVAAFIFHGGDAFIEKERALLYLLLFSVIFLLGPGDHSIDRTRARS